jgi:aconitate hydratase
LHIPSREVLPIWEAAQRYRETGDAVVLIAGERYGMGSSRDWAAKGQRLLGIRAVLAVSFERIHRSNLIGMGILPLRLPEGVTPQSLAMEPGDYVEINAESNHLSPRSQVAFSIQRQSGKRENFQALAAVETMLEVELLRAGGVIPSILQETIRTHETESIKTSRQ